MFKFLLLLGLLYFSGCAKQLVTKELAEKTWAVQNVTYEDSVHGLFFFKNNILTFKEDGECTLPYFSYSLSRASRWEFIEGNSKKFDVKFIGSDNAFLDGLFRGELIYDSLGFDILILSNNRLKLICNAEK